MKRSIASLGLIVVMLFVQACDPKLVSAFRLALASAGPAIDALVNAGVISADKAEQARAAKQDFSDGADVAIALQNELKTAGSDKGAKTAAVQKAEKAWRAIYERGNFKINQKVLTAANIADGIFSSIVLYYGGAPSSVKNLPMGARPQTDSAMEQDIKLQIKLLERSLK